MEFRLRRIRFRLTARAPIRFREDAAGNTLRGAFGDILSRQNPVAYSKIFEPPRATSGPSGLKDPPRPFVIRAAKLNGTVFGPGDPFSFDLHLFDCNPALSEAASAAFEEFARQRDADFAAVTEEVAVPLEPESEPVSRLAVVFETPTELKSAGGKAAEPEFGVLYARARDRVSTLRALYGEGALPLDFTESGRVASGIRLIQSDLAVTSPFRTSTRTGQSHALPGFTGTAVYEGELTPFLGILRAAEWTGIGSKTVWGNGAIRNLIKS